MHDEVGYIILFCDCCSITESGDLVDILEQLHDLNMSQFRRLGLQLGLFLSTMRQFEDHNADDFEMCVLEAWLNQTDNVIKRGGPPTWSRLIGALRSGIVNLKVHASKIQAWLKQGNNMY